MPNSGYTISTLIKRGVLQAISGDKYIMQIARELQFENDLAVRTNENMVRWGIDHGYIAVKEKTRYETRCYITLTKAGKDALEDSKNVTTK